MNEWTKIAALALGQDDLTPICSQKVSQKCVLLFQIPHNPLQTHIQLWLHIGMRNTLWSKQFLMKKVKSVSTFKSLNSVLHALQTSFHVDFEEQICVLSCYLVFNNGQIIRGLIFPDVCLCVAFNCWEWIFHESWSNLIAVEMFAWGFHQR